MVRRLGSLLVVVGSARVVPAVASAAYPAPFAVQGGPGLPSLDGSVHYVAQPSAPTRAIVALGDGAARPRAVVLAARTGSRRSRRTASRAACSTTAARSCSQSVGLKSTSRFVDRPDERPRAAARRSR